MNGSRVYIVQQGSARNPATGEKVPFDFSPAADYGELVYLLSPTASPSNPDSICRDLHAKLSHFTEKDFLVLTGNPALLAWACAIAGQYCPRVSLLQWVGRNKRYIWVKSPVDFGKS